VDPVPDYLNENRHAIHLGQVLGVPAPLVPTLPWHWHTAALVELELQARRARERARDRARAERKART
jgi:hypothetical protein